MKQIALTVVFALVFGLAALAQTQSSDQQGSSSPSSSQSQASPSTSPSTSQTPDMSSQSSQKSPGAEAKGEKKLKGCIESQGGQYLLKEKNGKEVALTGSADFASHVGHTVTVHGTPEKGGAAGSMGTSGSEKSSASAGAMGSSASSSGEQFMVSKIDHVSDTCKYEKGSKSGENDMGTGSNSTTSPTSSKPDQQ